MAETIFFIFVKRKEGGDYLWWGKEGEYYHLVEKESGNYFLEGEVGGNYNSTRVKGSGHCVW